MRLRTSEQQPHPEWHGIRQRVVVPTSESAPDTNSSPAPGRVGRARLRAGTLLLSGLLIGIPTGWFLHIQRADVPATTVVTGGSGACLFLTGTNYDLFPLDGGRYAKISAAATPVPTIGTWLVVHSSTLTLAYTVVSLKRHEAYWVAYGKLGS